MSKICKCLKCGNVKNLKMSKNTEGSKIIQKCLIYGNVEITEMSKIRKCLKYENV